MKRWTALLLGAVLGTQHPLAIFNTVEPHQDAHAGGPSAWSLVATAYAEEAEARSYTCPMHPHIHSDRAGQCPICGMDLVPVAVTSDRAQDRADRRADPTVAPPAAAQAATPRTILYWYDPMVPDKRFDKPGKSPFMDMDLQPKYADEISAQPATDAKPVLHIDAATVQKMGVRTEKVTHHNVAQGLRAAGRVMANERARSTVVTQVEGRIAALQASAEGDRIAKGDLLYTLISPELAALQSDYLAARSAGLTQLAAAAAARLTLLGVDARVLASLKTTQRPIAPVPFYATSTGVIDKLFVRRGAALKADDPILQLDDLNAIWIEAAVAETDLTHLARGDHATVSVAGATMPATIDTIYPIVAEATRTGRIRLIVDNPDGALKPGGIATIAFDVASEATLAVSSAAILRSSTGNHVIIRLGDGTFQARAVETGVVGGGYTQIQSGLSEGEEVVTSAQFLIDSESSLQESLQKLSAPPGEPQRAP